MNKTPRDRVAGLSITRMQGSNIIDGIRSKLIKEDHFVACTTRMFESLRATNASREAHARRRDSLARRVPYTRAHPHQTHPRGFRLFTCQRTKTLRTTFAAHLVAAVTQQGREDSTVFFSRVKPPVNLYSCDLLARGSGSEHTR